MISPHSLAEEYKDASLEELIAVRDELIESVRYFEQHGIDFDKHEMVPMTNENGCVIEPGPDVFYQMNLEYLAEICTLVQQAFNREYEQM